ncbi:Uncharacterised protein [Mycobacteroides abscessus subsp. abscessus]|nr:Uncharacterised protein [Mycobacteroides abscessus subsp. abscessus]
MIIEGLPSTISLNFLLLSDRMARTICITMRSIIGSMFFTRLPSGFSIATTAISAIMIYTTKSSTLSSPISLLPISRKIRRMTPYKKSVLAMIIIYSAKTASSSFITFQH